MLAVTCEDKSLIKFPVLCTPKLDGIRCLVIDGQAVSRKFKPIPNHYIRENIRKYCPEGLDGEIMIPNTTFNNVSSAVMTEEGKPNFKYYVFDYVSTDLKKPYSERMIELEALEVPDFVVKLIPKKVFTLEELTALEEKYLAGSYEGAMIRTPNSPYKCNRSTVKEGYLLKIKRFRDAEAEVVGFEERWHNENVATIDALGHSKRSSHQENMVGAGMLGSFIVRDLTTGITFSIGTGFNDEFRKKVWENPYRYIRKIVKYTYQEVGTKDAPRFPVFVGFRDEADMS
jgi:DNA ligase-1